MHHASESSDPSLGHEIMRCWARNHALLCACGGVCCCVLHASGDFGGDAAMPLSAMRVGGCGCVQGQN